MNVVVLTPDKEIFKGSIKSIKVPGIGGEFEILNNHAPIVSSLGSGKVRIIDDANASKIFSISMGFIEVLNNEVSVLVEGVTE